MTFNVPDGKRPLQPDDGSGALALNQEGLLTEHSQPHLTVITELEAFTASLLQTSTALS